MNVLIIGAGRMGLRHIKGCLASDLVEKISVLDISNLALENASAVFSQYEKYDKLSFLNLKFCFFI
jgi:saccharopine dehydrogenase-like NADP-dependent oxidoreductase